MDNVNVNVKKEEEKNSVFEKRFNSYGQIAKSISYESEAHFTFYFHLGPIFLTALQCPAGRVFQYRVGSGIGQNTG